MPDYTRYDRLYARLMGRDVGWAIYNKTRAVDLQPASLGYFDADGVWTSMMNLIDDDVRHEGWEPPAPMNIFRDDNWATWGPKYSSGVRTYHAGLDIGGSPLFRMAATKFKIEKSSSHGAILCTASPISHEKIADPRSLRAWIDSNSRKLIAIYGRELEEHGLWIITKTFSTQRAAIAILNCESSEVTIGLSADVDGFLNLTPDSLWLDVQKGAATTAYEDEARVVVFACGIYITKSRLSRSSLKMADKREKQQFLRAGNQTELFTIRTFDTDESEVLLDLDLYDKQFH